MKEEFKKFLILSIIIVGLFCFFYFASAHSGRTDSSGCHTCRTNCRSWGLSQGEYHCHRAKALPQPEPPVKSHRGYPEGYTEPAPEYEAPSTLPFSENEPLKSDKFTAQVAEENDEGFNWLWLLGIGGVIYIFYIIFKKK